MTVTPRAPLSLAIALIALCVAAPLRAGAPVADPIEDPALLEGGYLALHPDVEYRQLGIQAYRRGQLDTALQRFRRAGYYGDKPSQAFAAEMYWKGEGAPADRATAYIWMDLAAERGYPDLVALRERYWAAMTPDERKTALEKGPAAYKTYGDPTVKPRYERELRRKRNQITGSHVGMDIGVGGGRADQPELREQIPPGKFYAETHWNAQRYWTRQDKLWRQRLGGTVSVGDLERLGGEQPAESQQPAAPAGEPAQAEPVPVPKN
ncbi:sel1 repeat family protein [Lysobacter sp. K5869]|uniref:hypothetical protein n=1 Tax=Lysobacter sp. K5869 TaxID=2820808 RepID=UPI001C05F8DB|nr:hypothetical protein [Lysobacter sp. K5869]QWP77143.1 sel1 repeat family protein [Lysobacter sp. K5869]